MLSIKCQHMPEYMWPIYLLIEHPIGAQPSELPPKKMPKLDMLPSIKFLKKATTCTIR